MSKSGKQTSDMNKSITPGPEDMGQPSPPKSQNSEIKEE